MKYSVQQMVEIISIVFLDFQTMWDLKYTVKWKASKRKLNNVGLLLLPIKRHVELGSFMRGVSVDRELFGQINPLTPMSDQDRISLYNIDAILTR